MVVSNGFYLTDMQTCNGCLNLNVQRLCYAAQQCTLARCIGTLTNQNRPLCGIGKTGQAVLISFIVLLETAWNIFLETITTILGLALSPTPLQDGIQVRWIDDGFYGAICSCKDALVSFISILTSVINFVVQSVTREPLSYTDAGAQRLDSNFQAMFTLVITSFNSLLSQIMLAILYIFIVIQKVAICEMGALMALVSKTGFQVTIGIPEIQDASDRSLGKCLTQFHHESINTPSEGKNLLNFGSLVGDIVSSMSKAGVRSVLEVIKHPIDALITWTIGVITGVQDVIQTIDMAHCKLPDFYMKVCFYFFQFFSIFQIFDRSYGRMSSSAPATTRATRFHKSEQTRITLSEPSGVLELSTCWVTTRTQSSSSTLSPSTSCEGTWWASMRTCSARPAWVRQLQIQPPGWKPTASPSDQLHPFWRRRGFPPSPSLPGEKTFSIFN